MSTDSRPFAPNMGPPLMTPRKPPSTPAATKTPATANTPAMAFGMTPHKTPLRTPGGSKIEQTSSTPIIDFNAIESQKENVQPLAKGRSAHLLSSTLNMQHKQRQALLASQRAEHESCVTSIENEESDDPLEAWTKYVKWCIDNYPSGQTYESGLIPLLERSTRKFKDSPQYTNDPRYLRLWILYARNVECAKDVYHFLLANEIGTRLASLYEELAVVLEGQRCYDEADSIYRLGIARKATPTERLKRRFEEYKSRILLQQSSLIAEDPSLAATATVTTNYADALKAAMVNVGRSMLGEKESTHKGPARSHAANVLRGAGATIGGIGAASAGSTINNGRKLNVFQEDDENARSMQRIKVGESTTTPGWDDLGTVASRNQENIQGDRLPSTCFKVGANGGVSKKPGQKKSGLAVFKDSDDEDDEDDEQAPARGVEAPAGILNPKDPFSRLPTTPGGGVVGLGRKPQTSSETDLLRKNPFAYWDKEAKFVPTQDDLQLKSFPDGDVAVAAASRSSRPASSSATSQPKHRTKTTVSRSSSSSATSTSASAAVGAAAPGSKKERHAAPVHLLYPSSSSLEPSQKSFYKQKGWHNEIILEQLLATSRGFQRAVEGWESDMAPNDPWDYLDEFVGRWLPEFEEDGEGQQQEEEERAEDQPPKSPTMATPVADEPTFTAMTTGMFPNKDEFDPDNSVANAVALNLRPDPAKKKNRKAGRNGDDHTSKTTMSPTLVTKATLREVENMFNGEDSSSDEDDDDDDDDESSEEEDDDLVAALPSVSRNGPQMMRMGLGGGSGADVPPTPTPLTRVNGNRFHGLLQNDENAGVRATPSRTPVGGLGLKSMGGLGGATPLRTPLGNKPSASLADREVFREEDEDDNDSGNEQDRELAPGRSTEPRSLVPDTHAAPVSHPTVPATPMPTRQSAARRWIEPMAEEDEEEDEVEEQRRQEDGVGGESGSSAQDGEYQDEEAEYEPSEHPLFRAQFQPLTPITEATFEFTRYTNGGRTPGTATKSNVLRAWQAERQQADEDEEEDEEEGKLQDAVASRRKQMVVAADEEEELEQEGERSDVSTSLGADEGANQSGWTNVNKASFELTKGLTISSRAGASDETHSEEEDDDVNDGQDVSQFRLAAGQTNDELDDGRAMNMLNRFDSSLAIQDIRETEPQSSSHQPAHESKEDGKDEVQEQEQDSFVIPNPCSPINPAILSHILSRLKEPLEKLPNYLDLTSQSSEGKLADLAKKCKSGGLAANQLTRKSMGGTVFQGTGKLSSFFGMEIGGKKYEIRGKLGEGGYGAVYLGFDVDGGLRGDGKMGDSNDDDGDEDDEDDEDEDDEENKNLVAIKSETPANPWEFYILTQLQQRLPKSMLPSIISARSFVGYSDASFLFLDLGDKGTLLEVVNHAASAGISDSTGNGVDEILCMFFVSELLKVILSMHKIGIIHGDLKIDNCLLRLDELKSGGNDWSNVYDAEGANGWASKGLTLIDFGRAIDVRAYPTNQTFVADWDTDTKDCWQMREGQAFRYETDWFGVASIAHCLLFGKYIEVVENNSSSGTDSETIRRWKISSPLKRYWQTEIWNTLFDLCLNSHCTPNDGETEEASATPTTTATTQETLQKLEECLQTLQSYLEKNSNKGGKNLKGLLRKLQIWSLKNQAH